ncbi:PD40 domain-containing protein [Archangium violaceum]|uniref:LpqB family beta-propeller domain-containing protein n=1 Tax=Archangium violaceum TaxID=83451 RepID=UPI00194F0D8F|nr:LpqB family beta-propeller domain-containing protein [Archangium violaceum]QRN96871.1 PD40 domain-containing protein [Archangium violaceum]
MKSLWRILGLAVAAVGLSACEPFDDIDLGGGAGGGTAFSRGFVFVRDGSGGRNLYAVDDAGDPNFPLQLTTQGGAYFPAVSRNGRLVAFVQRVGSTFELRTVPTTGTGQPSTVFSSTNTNCAGCGNFRYPTFSPDGQNIVFTLDKGGYSLLARVSTDGRVFQQLTNSGYFYGPSSFMADGRSVIAARGSALNQYRDLVQVNLTTGLANVISPGLGNAGAQLVMSRVAVSPDGTKVAFDASTSSGSRIFVGQLDAQSQVYDVTQVTEKLGSEDTYPSWRGLAEIAFLSDAGGNDNVYRVSATSVRGSGALQLVVPVALEPAYGGP